MVSLCCLEAQGRWLTSVVTAALGGNYAILVHELEPFSSLLGKQDLHQNGELGAPAEIAGRHRSSVGWQPERYE